ncbi:MAG: hypothetical protein M3406_12525 [Chloroflexota bacterium]|nr:hypothetical protein [Chloroflexota bacterium]
MDEHGNLLLAIDHLPEDIPGWLRVALADGRYRIDAFSYANDLTVCPIVAAAHEAGVWDSDRIAPGNAAWGTPDGPSPEVEEFASWFDLCCEDNGVTATVETVREALGTPLTARVAA